MTLQNFEKSRTAMVLSQLQPSGVVDASVNQVYLTTPREMFVPSHLRGVSYLDGDIGLGDQRTLLEPLIHALMVQDAHLNQSSKVLDVGGATGYSAAILAQLAGNVTAVESNEKFLQTATKNWENLGIENIVPVHGLHKNGYAKSAPYDVIIINGAVSERPQTLLEQLKTGGKLYSVMVDYDQPVGKLMVFEKSENGQIFSKEMGDSMTSYLEGFEPKEKFHI